MLSFDSLVAGVRLLSLDAGNTIIFLDHARIAKLLGEVGFATDRDTLVRCEGEAKRLLEDGYGEHPRWPDEDKPGARSWGRTIGTILVQAGMERERVPETLAYLWRCHVELNFWWLVPDGLGPALDAVRAAGMPVVVVSNSEGMLDVLFEKLGLTKSFDLVVNSGKVGFEKPDARLWEVALAAYPTPPDAVLHLGDTYATDIAGAKALGFRTALIDPFAHYEGRHAGVARVPGAVEVAAALVRTASVFRRVLDPAQPGAYPVPAWG